MRLIELYISNIDWKPEMEILVHHAFNCETLEMRKALRLYGKEKVLWFTQSEVMLYKGD